MNTTKKVISISVLVVALFMSILGVIKKVAILVIIGVIIMIGITGYNSLLDKYTIGSIRDEILDERDDKMVGKYYGHRYNRYSVRRPRQASEDD